MPSIAQDVKYGARMLAKRPGLTAAAVLTLALGIGANTAIFSVVNAVLLRPLPYGEPDGLVRVYTRWEGFPRGAISQHEYFDLLDRNRVFEDLGLLRGESLNLTAGEGGPERVLGARLTPGVFRTLRADAVHGRTFLDVEGEAGRDRVALLGHGIWQRRFGGDEGVLGEDLEIEGESYTVVGVLPASFDFPFRSTELWLAYGLDRTDAGSRGNHSSGIVARLAPGMTLEAARADLDRLAAELMEEHPGNYPEGSGFGFVLIPLREEVVGQVRGALFMLLAAVGFVLAIACANVANLLLARASSRRREMATRTALGASRAHLLRQLLVESLILSVAGGAAALAVAAGGLKALELFQPGDWPRMDQISLDGTALVFTLALTVSTGLLFGLVPALRITGRSFHRALREGARGSDGASHHRLRHSLVVAEVALATVLLIGAGLLIRSFERLRRVDPGFTAENVVTTRLSLSRGGYGEDAAVTGFYRRLLEGLSARPGVAAAGAVSNPPFSGWTNDHSIGVEGYHTGSATPEFIELRVASPGYFEALGIPVLRGRAFTGADRADSQPVVVVSRTLAERFWGDADPLGRRIKLGGLESSNPWMTVVGVVGELRHEGLHAPLKPMYYLPFSQRPSRGMTVVVKMAGDAAGALDAVRRQVLEIDPLQPVYEVRTMAEAVAGSTAQPRFNLLLLATFAALAMVLAAIGVYGVTSYLVSQRTREIGVRMALGARGSDVLRNVMGHGLGLVGAGLALGLVGAFALTRFLAGFLFGVSVRDPLTFAVNSAVLVAVALVACLVPARRATRVDPTVALRYE